jgi:hypothetical protein
MLRLPRGSQRRRDEVGLRIAQGFNCEETKRLKEVCHATTTTVEADPAANVHWGKGASHTVAGRSFSRHRKLRHNAPSRLCDACSHAFERPAAPA